MLSAVLLCRGTAHLLFIVVVSLLTPAPSAEVLHEFDHYLDDPDDRHVDTSAHPGQIPCGRCSTNQGP